VSNISRTRGSTLVVFVATSAVLLAVIAAATATASTRTAARSAHPAFRVPAHIGGVVPPRGVHPAAPAARPGVDNLTYGNGPVMAKEEISYAIYWLPPTLQDGSATYMSSTYQPLIERYFGDVGGHGLYAVAKQYYKIVGSKQVNIRNHSSAGPVWMDTAPYPPSGCDDPATPGDCLSDAQIRAEVSHAIDVNHWKPSIERMFFVFTSYGEGSCFGSGPTGCAFTDYCAYHGVFAHFGPTIYANMPYLGTTGGCHTPTSPNGDIAADSTINVASHEEMESVTDPFPGSGWTSPEGEIGDKCVWFFGPLSYGGIANQQWNGDLYVLQEEWSNSTSACAQSPHRRLGPSA
jgi:hypothetical protein